MNKRLTIEQFIAHYAAVIDGELEQIFPHDWQIESELEASIHYSLTAGGKRLRPIMLFAAVEALGGSIAKALPIACAVELIHTYSLIHDDLPAMDDDDYRRGKPTNHRQFGEAMAILAGDGLLTHAFYLVASSTEGGQLTAEQAVTLCAEMAKYAGAKGMVGGQAADINSEQGVTSIAQLEAIHRRKTGDLIAFSLRAGGHLAGANGEQLKALQRFGHAIGLAFQIQDDVLDIIGDAEKMGKEVQSDLAADKVTYPHFIGLDASQEMVLTLTEQGKQYIEQADFPQPQRLYEISDYLTKRDH